MVGVLDRTRAVPHNTCSFCVPMVVIVLIGFKIWTLESFLGNGVTEHWWTCRQFFFNFANKGVFNFKIYVFCFGRLNLMPSFRIFQ